MGKTASLGLAKSTGRFHEYLSGLESALAASIYSAKPLLLACHGFGSLVITRVGDGAKHAFLHGFTFGSHST